MSLYSSSVSAGDIILASHVTNLIKDAVVAGADRLTSTGSADAYVLTASSFFVLTTGVTMKFKANFQNSGPATLNVNGGGAVAIKKCNDQPLGFGDIGSGQMVEVQYDGTYWQLLSIYANLNPLTLGQTEDNSSSHTHLVRATNYTAGETLTVSGNPLAVYISGGEGGRTTGRLYLSDSDQTTVAESARFHGFVTTTTSSGSTAVLKEGVVGGFSGLTAGSFYYLSTTGGGVTITPIITGASRICVGRAISSTQIDTDQREQFQFYCQDVDLSVPGAADSTATTQIITYFKPWRIRFDGYVYICESGGATCARARGSELWNESGNLIKAFYSEGDTSANISYNDMTESGHIIAEPSGGANRSELKLDISAISSYSFTLRLTNTTRNGVGSTNGQAAKGLVTVYGFNT